MYSESETIHSIKEFFEDVACRAERAEKRLRNDEGALQCYPYFNRKLVSTDELRDLHATMWRAVQRASFAFDYVSTWYANRGEGCEDREDDEA